MDIWQFWLSIGIIFALLGFIIAILVRKHKDKHKIAGLQKNLEDLEKSFLHLQEEMEVATNQNLKTMEEKCESMRELLAIADKKCLYAGDLLKAIDKGTEVLKERNISLGAQIVTSPVDEEKILERAESKINAFSNTFKDDIDSINRRLGHLNNRLKVLEDRIITDETSVSSDTNSFAKELKSEIVDIRREMKNLNFSISEMVTNEISSQLEGLDTGFAEIATKALDIEEKGKAKESNIKDNISTGTNGKITELFPKIIDSSSSTHTRKPEKMPEVAKEDMKLIFPKGKELVVKEILEKHEQGISIPQIAAELKMNRGEIALIIKMNTNIINNSKVENYGN